MKAKIMRESREFEPFEINIKIESVEEARELWHRFNYTGIGGIPGYSFEKYKHTGFNIANVGSCEIRRLIEQEGVLP